MLMSHHLTSQISEVGLELQIYPTGITPTINMDHNFGDKHNFHARIGLNLFNHRNLGKQDQEKGSGFGFSLGYRKYFKEKFQGWRIGIKNDLWWNTVNWRNGINNPNEDSGQTKILVLQPTVEIAKVYRKDSWSISPSLALGIEWNVITDGLPTGEGPIVLLGVQIMKHI